MEIYTWRFQKSGWTTWQIKFPKGSFCGKALAYISDKAGKLILHLRWLALAPRSEIAPSDAAFG